MGENKSPRFCKAASCVHTPTVRAPLAILAAHHDLCTGVSPVQRVAELSTKIERTTDPQEIKAALHELVRLAITHDNQYWESQPGGMTNRSCAPIHAIYELAQRTMPPFAKTRNPVKGSLIPYALALCDIGHKSPDYVIREVASVILFEISCLPFVHNDDRYFLKHMSQAISYLVEECRTTNWR